MQVIMPKSVDENFEFNENYQELFTIARNNRLKVVFQTGLRPGPWSVQGPDSLAPICGGENLEDTIERSIQAFNNWRYR